MSIHFVAIHFFATENCKEITKSLIYGVQSHSKSSMLISLKSTLPVLVVISSTYVPIYKRFHVRQDNSEKITTF